MRMLLRKALIPVTMFGALLSVARESPGVAPHRAERQAPGDSAAVAAIVERFHAAIVAGDSTLAMSLLAPDVVVLESGGIETRDEFRARHLGADIAFAQAVKSVRGPLRVVVGGDAAWVGAGRSTSGDAGGRQVMSGGGVLVVVTRPARGRR